MIFVLSALTPERVPTALATVFRALRPGGVLLFRDYAVNDGAHKKMTNKKGAVLIHYRLRICTRLINAAQAERKLGENFYVRGDGTQVIYFEKGASAHREHYLLPCLTVRVQTLSLRN